MTDSAKPARRASKRSTAPTATAATPAANAAGASADAPPFSAVALRHRHDGWTPERQKGFIEALGDSGSVEAAARSVGMTRNSAYALRRRADAQAFRLAWEAATDLAVARLADAALERAIHGVAVPIFHGGEQIGERRQFNERLTMFLLRQRDPVNYGHWRDKQLFEQPQDSVMVMFAHRLGRVVSVARLVVEALVSGSRLRLPVEQLHPAPYDPNDPDDSPDHPAYRARR